MVEPVQIEPEALYDDGSLCQALGLTPATLAAARRAGSLRYTRQGKRIFYKGAWVSAWLETAAATAQSPARRPPEGMVSNDTSPPPQARRGRSWPCQTGRYHRPPARGPHPEANRGRTLPAGIEPMLGIDDLAALLSCSRRLVERMRSAGKVPKPDIQIGKMPAVEARHDSPGSRGVASHDAAPRAHGRWPELAGMDLNGELDALAEPWRSMAAHLAGLPPQDRPAASIMLAARPDRDELVKAIADQDPNGPPPEDDGDALDEWEPIRLGTLPPVEPFPLDVLPVPGPRPGDGRRRVDRLPGRLPRRGDPGRRLGLHRPFRQPADQARLLRVGIALRGARGKPVKRQVSRARRRPGPGLVHRPMLDRRVASGDGRLE